jgi:hypothetical protein
VTPVDGHPLAEADGLGAEQEQALLALGDLRQVLLRDGVAVLGDGGDDLVEVRGLARLDEEDVLAAARLQGLEDRRGTQGPHPLLELVGGPRHQGLGPHVGGEIPEVHAAAGSTQPLRIVQHQGPAEAQAPPEVDEGGRGARVALAGGVEAQEHHVEAGQVVFLHHRLVGAERVGVLGRGGVVSVPHPAGGGEHRVVVEERQLVHRHEAHVVAAPVRRQGDVDPREGHLLGAGVPDYEADPHGGHERQVEEVGTAMTTDGMGAQPAAAAAAAARCLVRICSSRSSGRAGAT